MTKALLTYFFASVLLLSVVVPSCHALLENDSNIELSSELGGEEEENKDNKAEEDIQIKINYTNASNYLSVVNTNQKNVVFIAKSYSSFRVTLESPPPEFIG